MNMSWVKAMFVPAKINADNGKATTIPIFNLYCMYGRCFFFAWFGFFVAFLSWFAFPPLMEEIQEDLHLTPSEVSNSNVVGLCSTLLARFALGPLCERFGPRWVMAGTLFVGAVPTAFVPLVNNMEGIYAIRFFIGLLGGTFIPCQFWISVFFDKSIYGRAAALAAGWGNAGGGVAFFVMPAIMRSFQHRGYSFDHSWKYTFDVCPLIIIMFVAICVVLLGADCPEGKWSERTTAEHSKVETVEAQNQSSSASTNGDENPEKVVQEKTNSDLEANSEHQHHHHLHLNPVFSKMSQVGAPHLGEIQDTSETIEKPTWLDTFKVSFSIDTMLTALPYACSFGTELAVESVISALYLSHSKQVNEVPWTKSLSGNWGAMLGLLNVVTRPMGGFISDYLFAYFKTAVAKKFWMITCIFMTGVFLLYTGLYNTISMPGLIVSIAFMSWFVEMANGAVYALVPHINPHHTGIVSGTTGSFGNIGGVLLSLAFRFSKYPNGQTNYIAPLWHLGVVSLGISVITIFIPVKYKT